MFFETIKLKFILKIRVILLLFVLKSSFSLKNVKNEKHKPLSPVSNFDMLELNKMITGHAVCLMSLRQSRPTNVFLLFY